MMKKTIHLLLTGLMALTACSDDENFKITGEIAGEPSMNLYVKYYGNDAVQTAVTIANKGKFEVTGASVNPTMVEFLDNEYNVIGRAYVQNGDKVHLSLDRRNPYLVAAKGTDVNQRWAEAVSAHADSLIAGSAQTVNDIVEEYVAGHPDDVVSTLMFATSYNTWLDPLRADSVLQSIDAKARPSTVLASYAMVSHRYANPASYGPVGEIRYRTVKNDTAEVFNPADKALSLMVFSDENSQRTDSVVPHLKRLRKDVDDKRLQIIDFFFPADTFTFVRGLKRDSADWIQAWAPGGIFAAGVDRLAIPGLPYYIVTDSTGTQLYRGRSAAAAEEVIDGIKD